MPKRGKLFALLLVVLIAVFAAGCEPDQAATTPPPKPAPVDKQPAQPAAETMTVTVYFATKDAMYLVPETRTVPKSGKPLEAAVTELLSEPKSAGLVRVLPAGTRLKGITVKDHIAYVDFSDRLVKGGSGGSAGEILTVGAIVNTVTEFADIYKVQILVEGKKVATLYGHLDTSEPLSRSESIVKKSL
jgi:germination protein M